MIEYQTSGYPEEEILENLHPFVREWFVGTFGTFSPPQRFAIRNIQLGMNCLISSPTGSGKTLSAFLAVLNELVVKADTGTLTDSIQCVYVSPLKALANDIHRNLTEPLAAITLIAERYGRKLDITVRTRTGDTTAYERQKMRDRPPHILVTTPESLAIALTSPKFSEALRTTRYVIVDEIHAFAENKRGTHLSITLERLTRYAVFTRVGLSATVAPLEEVAKFLVGYEDQAKKLFRPCRIVSADRLEGPDGEPFRKPLDIQVLSPVPDLVDASHPQMQDAMYSLIHRHVQEHKTTLIFTNTRAATERVVHQLKDRYPGFYGNVLDSDEDAETQAAALAREEGVELPEEEQSAQPPIVERNQPKSLIGAHHGSLSREHRLRIENMLKAGELRVVVCSTSLELGIDIGAIDLVLLLGSPKSVARALQRIGRAGHQLHATAKGRIIVLDRDDLIECATLVKTALERIIDRIDIPKRCLDVLAQTLYGLSIEGVMTVDEAWHVVTRSYSFDGLTKRDFDAVLTYLAGETKGLEARHVYGKISIDRVAGTFQKRGKLARLIYLTNVGTIPDETSVRVKIGDVTIGTITEDFNERMKPGDVFVLGGEAYEFQYSRGMTAQVRPSAGRLPTVPSWVSESLPLNHDLALAVQRVRRSLSQLCEEGKSATEIAAWVKSALPVDEPAARSIAAYATDQHRYSRIPHLHRIVIEHFRDGTKKHTIVHGVWGRRVNDVLARAVAFANAKLTGRDVELTVTDNGFTLRSAQPIHAIRALRLLKPEDLDRLMEQTLERSEILKRRFRHCATRSLMILRSYKGETKSVGKQQVSSQIIFSTVKGLGREFPILKEAYREILEDLMDIKHAKEVLTRIQPGEITLEERSTELPSPFGFGLVLQGYADLLKVEDRIEFIRRLNRMVIAEINGEKQKATDIMPKVEFTYEKLWEEQSSMDKLKADDYTAFLHEQVRNVSRKISLDADIVYHLHRLIDGEETKYPEKFALWMRTLITGTVPKVWPDELVKLFQEKEKTL